MTRGGPPPQAKRSKSTKKSKEKKPEERKAQVENAGKDDRSTVPVRAGPPPRPQISEPQFEMLTPPPKPNSTPEPQKPEIRSEPVKQPSTRTWGRAGAPPTMRHKTDGHNRVGPIMMTVETTTSVVTKTESGVKHEIGLPVILPYEPPPRKDSLKRRNRDIPFTNIVTYYKPMDYTV